MKRSYIPQGAHQQGRIKRTGAWLPRRMDGTPEAAHAVAVLDDEADAWEPMTWQETARFVAPGVVAVAAVVVLAFFGWR